MTAYSEPLDFSTLDPTERRPYVAAVLNYLVPSKVGDAKFAFITQGRATAARRAKQFFSTCGELGMAVLYCVGYRGPNLNRDMTAEVDGVDRSYKFGANMRYLFSNMKRDGLFVQYEKGLTPKVGDIIFLSNGPPKTEHVCIFKQEKVDTGTGVVYWETWDAGVYVTAPTEQESRVRLRRLEHGALGGRKVRGWTDLERLPITAKSWVIPS